MGMPGFTAAESIYPKEHQYRAAARYIPSTRGAIEPAVNWGSIQDNGCLSDASGTHRFSAILWNIPWGQSWEETCIVTPGPGGTPVAGILPTRCVNTGLNIWGEWDVPDSSCRPPCLCTTPALAGCTFILESCTLTCLPVVWNPGFHRVCMNGCVRGIGGQTCLDCWNAILTGTLC
jgi:hypothetical protein